jgi:hypothetical protein
MTEFQLHVRKFWIIYLSTGALWDVAKESFCKGKLARV